MTEIHRLGVSLDSKQILEAVNPLFVREGLLQAQRKTWNALRQLRLLLVEGMREDEARKLALSYFLDLGVSKHWHKPYIRFGPGTMLTFHDPLQADYRLKAGDPLYIDLGPVWPATDSEIEYEGDAGDTFVQGANLEAERCAATARELFKEVQMSWKSGHLSGEGIYQFLKERTSARGFKLVEKVDGHRLGDFPHHKYSKERLARLQFSPSADLWVLEIQIIHPELNIAAFFEDLL